ncbi:MAG: hypothetical protein HQ525_08470 [Anaerolineae bacterium]|nr:hypothetical protein [Anaerolineae bacterium]
MKLPLFQNSACLTENIKDPIRYFNGGRPKSTGGRDQTAGGELIGMEIVSA